ncbi:MAG TPA: ferrochelatase [Rhodospirillales bacterium]|nr:ferrochelatase [Rhodospirillales bacterium]
MKVAVVLFNLGGPDRPDAIRPFLRNLFSDPAIIGAPAPIRWLLARWISCRRAPVARGIYQHLGGKSPLLELTQKQARSLEEQFDTGDEIKAFIAMRYWHPMSDETAREVRKFAPNRIILLPLYPQFSTTTTGSSLSDWERASGKAGVSAPTAAICCYPEEGGFVSAIAARIEAVLGGVGTEARPRVLFTAHGLPKKIVDRGDPYPDHVERTATAIVEKLGRPDLDWTVCYQSRVGPLEWIGPQTEDEVVRAGRDGVPLVVVPIAFVSEHSETLVELDIEYRKLAMAQGVPSYHRVKTVCTDPVFIGGLKNLVELALESIKEGDSTKTLKISSSSSARICPARDGKCPNS